MTSVLWVMGAAAAVLGLAVAAELSLRRWWRRWGGYYAWPPGLRFHFYLDREVFPELEPLARIEINADGERAGVVPRGGASLYRVLVAGGSPVECALLDQPTSWPSSVERLLKAPDCLRTLGASDVHVGNIGLSGVTAQGLNFMFKHVLPRYRRLNAILIMVGGNDVASWLAKGCPHSITGDPIIASEIFSCHPEGPFHWTPRGLALSRLCQQLYCRWVHPVKVRRGAGKWVGRARVMRAGAKELRSVVPDPTPMLDFFESHLREILGRATRHADRVLIVRQPWFETDYTAEDLAKIWHGAMGNPQQEEVSVYYSIEVVCELMALLDARAVQVAYELGVETLNLMPRLELSRRTFYDFIHFTPAGAVAVGEAVTAAILRRTASGHERRSFSAPPHDGDRDGAEIHFGKVERSAAGSGAST